MNDQHESEAEPTDRRQFLENLWEEHMRHEFATHNTEDTLTTMVDDAYVNHIPVLTGGVGKEALREFYSKRFIPQMPPDTEVTPVSRTIGTDQLLLELLLATLQPKQGALRAASTKLSRLQTASLATLWDWRKRRLLVIRVMVGTLLSDSARALRRLLAM
jgi:hypothetical protein